MPAGVVDASFASLGTFVAALAAVNLLSDVDRGVYGVFFAAFVVGTTVPHNLVYLPSQVFAVAQPLNERLSYIGRISSIGMGWSMLGSLAIVAAAVATASQTSSGVIVALTLTAIVNVGASTVQDNLRRMLHIAGLHWSAASLSIVQFFTVSVVLGGMLAVDVPVVWVPFGSLIVANIVSSTVGIVRAGGLGRWRTPVELSTIVLSRFGRWLLGQAMIPTGATFLAATLITLLAGAVAMGYAESARVVAQPVLVFATGLTSVLGPRVMAAAQSRNDVGGSAMLKRFAQLTFIAGVLYLGLAGWAAPWNPMVLVVQSAYVVPGLVAVSIVANIASGMVFLRVEELIGARREIDLVKVSSFASIFMIALALTATITESFALPLGVLALSIARYVGCLRYRRRFYRVGDPLPEG